MKRWRDRAARSEVSSVLAVGGPRGSTQAFPPQGQKRLVSNPHPPLLTKLTEPPSATERGGALEADGRPCPLLLTCPACGVTTWRPAGATTCWECESAALPRPAVPPDAEPAPEPECSPYQPGAACGLRLGDAWIPARIVRRRQRRGYVELRVAYAIEHAGRRVEVTALLDAASPDLRPEPLPAEIHPEKAPK